SDDTQEITGSHAVPALSDRRPPGGEPAAPAPDGPARHRGHAGRHAVCRVRPAAPGRRHGRAAVREAVRAVAVWTARPGGADSQAGGRWSTTASSRTPTRCAPRWSGTGTVSGPTRTPKPSLT